MNFKKKLVIVTLLTTLVFSSGGIPGTNAEELLDSSNNDSELKLDKSPNLSPVKDGDVVDPFSTLVDQQISFQSEGFASFTYRGGESLEVSIANGGNNSFKWVITAPDHSRFHSGILQAGEKMKWTYLDFEAPNGTYTLYIYNSINNSSNSGLAGIFVRTIEL
ncbi:hypothetical protein [Viridibacillus arvi]|uniref:hypothetical protein n=1 Tax=Viridibacillus arvi TaxID=263475 RepID=UPI003D06FC36